MLRAFLSAVAVCAGVGAAGEAAHQKADPETDECVSKMRTVCDGTYGGNCTSCATKNAQILLKAGCTNEGIRNICESGELACLQMGVSVVAQVATSAPSWNLFVTSTGPLRSEDSLALPPSHCFQSSSSPLQNYIISGSRVVASHGSVAHALGEYQLQAVMLQLQGVADMGPLGTSVHLTAQSFKGYSPSSPSGSASIVSALERPVNPSELRPTRNKLASGGAWNIPIEPITSANISWRIEFTGLCDCGSSGHN
jgi:hypothetical protein|eukprot:COSAG01_NODE_1345_length_10632_cov_648.255863_11_plen_254_part_00